MSKGKTWALAKENIVGMKISPKPKIISFTIQISQFKQLGFYVLYGPPYRAAFEPQCGLFDDFCVNRCHLFICYYYFSLRFLNEYQWKINDKKHHIQDLTLPLGQDLSGFPENSPFLMDNHVRVLGWRPKFEESTE